MAKQFNLTINSPVVIGGGFTVSSGLNIVVTIIGVDLRNEDYDVIQYSKECYVSEATKISGEPQVNPKGVSYFKLRGHSVVNSIYKINTDQFAYDIAVTSNKSEFTAASESAFATSTAQIVADELGINISDIIIG